VESENSAEVLEEAESLRSGEAETDLLENADNDALAESEAEEANETLAELAVEDAPIAGESEDENGENEDGA